MNKLNFFAILSLNIFLFSSCSSLLQKYYAKMDKVKPKKRIKKRKVYDKFAMYRKYVEDNLNTISSTYNSKFKDPGIKRRYEKRIKASDLTDQSNPGSLWYDGGQENFFFSQNDAKRSGDIILIHVLKRLKDQIGSELQRIFPDSQSNVAKNNTIAQAPTPEGSNEATDEEKDSQDKVYDQLSSVVIEAINRDHLIIRGIKDVLYKKRKHMIEIKALVKRSKINDNDVIKSDDFLESSVRVLR